LRVIAQEERRINFNEPISDLKAGKDHRVPLSSHVLVILHEQNEVRTFRLAMTEVLRRMGRAEITCMDFGRLIADETEKWAKVIKFAGIKPQ
jgi:hypothetical protein